MEVKDKRKKLKKVVYTKTVAEKSEPPLTQLPYRVETGKGFIIREPSPLAKYQEIAPFRQEAVEQKFKRGENLTLKP